MKASTIALGVFAFGGLIAVGSTASNDSLSAGGWVSVATEEMKDMFNTSIQWNDMFWDDRVGYLIAANTNPGRYDSRHTGWYATQLLARNEPGDVDRAVRIFDNLLANQYLDPAAQWYGDWQQAPSQPVPGTTEYPDDGPYSSVSSLLARMPCSTI